MVSYLPGWPDQYLWLVVIAFLAAALLCFGMGANDCANSYGTSVGSGVLTLVKAYILATIFEILGAGLLGYKVADTIRSGIVNVGVYNVSANYNGTEVPLNSSVCATMQESCYTFTDARYLTGSLGSIIGAALWLCIANVLKLPVSVTHSVVGATIGYSLVYKGVNGIAWLMILRIAASWIISPLLAGLTAVVVYTVVKYAALKRPNPFEASLRVLPVFYFITVAINVFMVLFSKSKYLGFDQLPLWACFIIALGVSTLVAVLVRIFLVARIRKWAANEVTKSMHNQSYVTAIASGAITSDTNLSVAHTTGTRQPIAMPWRNDSVATSVYTLSVTDAELADVIKDKARPVPVSSKAKKYLVLFTQPVVETLEASRVFAALQVLSACFMSFTHGANDVANGVGALVGIWTTYKNGHALTDMSGDPIPQAIIIYGAVTMIVGLWCLGHKVIETVGKEITEVTPASGFSMELGTAITVLVASNFGIPISTTHCLVGAVVFVGWYKAEASGVSWKVFRNIAAAWVITLPVSAGFSAFFAYLFGFTA